MTKIVDIYKKNKSKVAVSTHNIPTKPEQKVKDWFDEFCKQLLGENNWQDAIQEIQKYAENGKNSVYQFQRYYDENDSRTNEYPIPEDISHLDMLKIIKKTPFEKRLFKGGHPLDECKVCLNVYYDVDVPALMFSGKAAKNL